MEKTTDLTQSTTNDGLIFLRKADGTSIEFGYTVDAFSNRLVLKDTGTYSMGPHADNNIMVLPPMFKDVSSEPAHNLLFGGISIDPNKDKQFGDTITHVGHYCGLTNQHTVIDLAEFNEPVVIFPTFDAKSKTITGVTMQSDTQFYDKHDINISSRLFNRIDGTLIVSAYDIASNEDAQATLSAIVAEQKQRVIDLEKPGVFFTATARPKPQEKEDNEWVPTRAPRPAVPEAAKTRIAIRKATAKLGLDQPKP